MTSRLLLSETMDPDGAMYRWLSPDVAELGWEVLRVPTQQAIHRLGPVAYRALLVELAGRWRPHVLLVHPPYDYLDIATAEAIRAVGTRLVAFAFDDPITLPAVEASGELPTLARDMAAMFDLYTTTDERSAEVLRAAGLDRARPLQFASSLEPHQATMSLGELAGELAGAALLIGRAYPARVELVSELARRGLRLFALGRGWPDVADRLPESVGCGGPVTREWMNQAYATAGVVITTGDWEDQPVPMVKYRLLEVALAGGFQIAQASRDLPGYFPESAVPSYADAAQLAELAQRWLADEPGRRGAAESAREHALSQHRWKTRWPELLAALYDVDRGLGQLGEPDPLPAAYQQLLSGLGLASEQAGRLRVACEHYLALAERDGTDFTALAGLGRCAYALGEPAAAAEALSRAEHALTERASPTARPLHLHIPAAGEPPGMGRLGYLHPRAEVVALLLVALVDAGRTEEALERLQAIEDPDLLVTVAAHLEIPKRPRTSSFWVELCRHALAATPQQQAQLKAELAPHLTSALEALRGG